MRDPGPTLPPGARGTGAYELETISRPTCGQGIGYGAVGEERADLVPLTGVLDEVQTELWLLTHSEARHLRRVGTVYHHLAEAL